MHYSTDYVFNGSGATPWREDDACDPLNVYGATKLAGERAIQATGCRHLIFRTSWVYGARGSNFLLTMRRLMRERPELKIVADQIGAPTWCRDLAEATAQVLSQINSPRHDTDQGALWGVYHMTNAGETSWHGFAQAIQALDASDETQCAGPPASHPQQRLPDAGETAAQFTPEQRQAGAKVRPAAAGLARGIGAVSGSKQQVIAMTWRCV